ncbi:hypothetical protein [Rheinheimera sp. MM224]|uniref:hypothetical protein n=1 Tax=Rheinheimera sp. MM224 TaxID=3019969 RepID=UPI0021F8EB10|nr:hypothetical protein [Rheinheimera sp. MM224]CAI3795747.1 hypothetical protein JAMGFMIE_01395 [Rheinheimera sp. MM224]CAI3795909.1 hypothetical protein JAMGFMIE_01435 [Rheinheimera sp. MM224]
MDILISAFLIVLVLFFSAYFGLALIKSEKNLNESPERIAEKNMGNRAHYMIIKYCELITSPDSISKAIALKNFQENALKYSEDYEHSIMEVISRSEEGANKIHLLRPEAETNKG